jgi:hypothetical protein
MIKRLAYDDISIDLAASFAVCHQLEIAFYLCHPPYRTIASMSL